MRVIFAGTPEFACSALKAIDQTHQVVAVFTQPDRKVGRGKVLTAPPVKQIAQELGLSVYQPSSFSDQQQLISSFDAEVMVVVAYGMILPEPILNIPKHGCINIHASLLPKWRGAAPIQRSIEAGDIETGVSIMQMEKGLDTGPVYQTLSLAISDSDTSASLHDKLADLGAEGIVSTLAKLELKEIEASPQNHELASYAKKLEKSEAIIDWSDAAIDIERQIRAFNPWPICQTQHLGVRLRIWQAKVLASPEQSSPGKVLSVDKLGICVQCGQGQLLIEKVQRDGGKAVSVEQFINGYEISAGDLLG